MEDFYVKNAAQAESQKTKVFKAFLSIRYIKEGNKSKT